MPKTLSAADSELIQQHVSKTFVKVRQFIAERKAITDAEKTAFASLSQKTGLTKQQFMEGFKRANQKEGQLNLFDQGASRVEDVLREILAEKVKAKDVDKETEATRPGKRSATAKKAAAEKPNGKKAANGNGKKIDAVSPPDLPGRRTSARAQPQAGFVDRNERMSTADLHKLQAANSKPD